jgi:hypothetical protein
MRTGNCSNARLLGCIAFAWPRIVEELRAGPVVIEIR